MAESDTGKRSGLSLRERWSHPAFRRGRDIAYWAFVVLLAFVVYRRFAPGVDLQDLGPAPALEMASLDGETVRLDQLRGRVVVLNVWATWCAPCRIETPGFVDLQREFGNEVQFLGLSTDDDVSVVEEFVDKYDVIYPILVGRNAAGTGYDVPILPTTFLVDREGRVRFRHEGLLLAHALRASIRSLLRE